MRPFNNHRTITQGGSKTYIEIVLSLIQHSMATSREQKRMGRVVLGFQRQEKVMCSSKAEGKDLLPRLLEEITQVGKVAHYLSDVV